MASLMGAIKSALGDQWWLIKFVPTVAVLYYFIQFSINSLPNDNARFILYFFAGALMLGISTVAMHRNINNYFPIFPSLLDIPEVVTKTIGSIISILLGSVITLLLYNFVTSLDVTDVVRYIFYGLIVILMAPCIFIPLILYSARGKITDAFRYLTVFNSAGSFVAAFILLLIQIVIIYGIACFILYFFINQMFKTTISADILITAFSVMAFFTSMIYFSDLYGDSIPEIGVPKSQDS